MASGILDTTCKLNGIKGQKKTWWYIGQRRKTLWYFGGKNSIIEPVTLEFLPNRHFGDEGGSHESSSCPSFQLCPILSKF